MSMREGSVSCYQGEKVLNVTSSLISLGGDAFRCTLLTASEQNTTAGVIGRTHPCE